MASVLIGRRRRERKSARKIQPHLLIDASNGPQVRSGGGGRCRRKTRNQEGQSNPEGPGERTDVARCRGPKIRDVAEGPKSGCIRPAGGQESERGRGGGLDGKAGKNGGDHRRDEPDGTIRAPLVRAYVEGPAHGSPGTVGTTSAGGAGPADAGSVMRPSKMSCAK